MFAVSLRNWLVIGWVCCFALGLPTWEPSRLRGEESHALEPAVVWQRVFQEPPRFCELERRLFEDAQDRSLDHHALLEGALIASGVESEQELSQYLDLANASFQGITTDASETRSRLDYCRRAFGLMHGRILSGEFGMLETDVRRTLIQGDFNCLTSTILFNSLLAQAGVSASARAVPGHVYSVFQLDETSIEVETTCRQWMDHLDDEGVQKRLRDSAWRDAALENSQYRVHEVDDVGLISLVYYNRGVDGLEKGDFADSIRCNLKSLLLEPTHRDALLNVVAAINNWGLRSADEEDFSRAIKLLRLSLALDPDKEQLRKNFLVVLNRYVQHLEDRGAYPSALETLRQHVELARDVDEAMMFSGLERETYQKWCRHLIDQRDYPQARQVVLKGLSWDAADAALLGLQRELAARVAEDHREIPSESMPQ